jgi:hypothetical protein
MVSGSTGGWAGGHRSELLDLVHGAHAVIVEARWTPAPLDTQPVAGECRARRLNSTAMPIAQRCLRWLVPWCRAAERACAAGLLSETGAVNEAWASLVEKTRETALAHSETADQLQEQVGGGHPSPRGTDRDRRVCDWGGA